MHFLGTINFILNVVLDCYLHTQLSYLPNSDETNSGRLIISLQFSDVHERSSTSIILKSNSTTYIGFSVSRWIQVFHTKTGENKVISKYTNLVFFLFL